MKKRFFTFLARCLESLGFWKKSLLSGYNDLLCGSCGLAGMPVFLVADALIFLSMKRKHIYDNKLKDI